MILKQQPRHFPYEYGHKSVCQVIHMSVHTHTHTQRVFEPHAVWQNVSWTVLQTKVACLPVWGFVGNGSSFFLSVEVLLPAWMEFHEVADDPFNISIVCGTTDVNLTA